MFNKKKIISISLIIILFLLIALLVVFNKNIKPKNLEDLSIKQLTKIRENDIDKNLEDLSKYGKDTIQERKDYKDEILKSDYGLVAFINYHYKNLSEKDRLIKEIKIIEYLNSKEDIMDPSGDFFKYANEDYQLSEYLLKHGRDSDFTSYENAKFLINNFEDVSNFIDYDLVDLILKIEPSIKSSLSQDQMSSLSEDIDNIFAEDNSNTIKSIVKKLQKYIND